MRVIIKLAIAVLVIVLGVYITGSLLPETHVVSRSITLSQTQEKVWDLITDNTKMKEWNPDMSDIRRLPDSKEGNEVWRFEDKSRHYMVVESVEKTSPSHLTNHITETDYPFGGDWIFDLETTEDGKTKLTLTEKGTVSSPFCRFFTHFIMGYDKGVKMFLENVAKKFNEEVVVTAE